MYYDPSGYSSLNKERPFQSFEIPEGGVRGDNISSMLKRTAEAKYLTSIEKQVTEINKANLPEWIADSYTDGIYRTVETNETVTLYRTFGGRADAGGGFATTVPADSRIEAKIDTIIARMGKY